MGIDWTLIITSFISVVVGGVLGKIIDKRKTPYTMLQELLDRQARYLDDRIADFEREKLDGAEKSAVIMKSGQCEHRFKDPNIHCPVDEANNERLEKRCLRCGYNSDNAEEK